MSTESTIWIVLLAHAGATWFMSGVIWIVQVVHYPLFAGVGADRFADYERAHQRRITRVVAPAMFVELGLAIALVLMLDGPALRLAWAGLALLAVNWVSTFAVQVPAHTSLAGGFDERAHKRLLATNWVRTAAWSARGVIALVMIPAFVT